MKALLLIFGLVLGTSSCKTYNLLEEKKSLAKQPSLDSTFLYNPDYQYRIRKDDKINLSVWGQDDLSVGSVYGIYNSNEVYGKWLLVDGHGNISVPKLGVFNVLGLTLAEMKDTLTSRFGKWIQNPVVDVKVMNREITVLGEVRNPGVVLLDKEQNRLLELLSKTGGIEFYGNLKKVKVLRQQGADVKIAHIDLSKSGQYSEQNIQLQPGDVVIVSSKKHKEFEKRISTIIPFSTALTAAAILLTTLGL